MKIKKVAFIYLKQKAGDYYVTDDPGYSVQRRPKLGLQYLCAVLEKQGITTNMFDQTVHSFDLNWLLERIKDCDLVGFYCSDPQEKIIKLYSERIKKELNIPILVGGPSTLTNFSFLNHGCDIVVHGEGELTLQHIIDYYEGKRKLKEIKGISYKKDNKIIKNPPQDLIENLDELPFPNRTKIDINSYYDYFLFGMKKPYITMVASRGCIHRCYFCTSCKIWGNRYRIRSVDNVISEIDKVVERHGIRYIAFQDDIFGVTNDWIEEFCQKLINKSYKIKWMAILHPLSIVNDTEKMLRLMKKAGCDTLSFGLQTAHPQILKNINRNPSEPIQLRKTIKLANKIGFITAVGYIFGLPGDTKETIQTTIDYSLDSNPTLVNYYNLSILKGSELEVLYKDKEVSNLTKEEIEKLTVYASRKFYTKPRNVLKIIYFIIKNPGWIIRVGARLPSILSRVGY